MGTVLSTLLGLNKNIRHHSAVCCSRPVLLCSCAGHGTESAARVCHGGDAVQLHHLPHGRLPCKLSLLHGLLGSRHSLQPVPQCTVQVGSPGPKFNTKRGYVYTLCARFSHCSAKVVDGRSIGQWSQPAACASGHSQVSGGVGVP
jgi:hypothetical protein